MGWKDKTREEDFSPEVRFLIKQIKFEELIPKTRDAVNLFFLNVRTSGDSGEVSAVALLRPVYRAITKKEDVIDKGGLRAVVTLLTSQTPQIQLQAAQALGSLAADADDTVMEALRTLNVHITSVKMLSTPISEQLLSKLLYILSNIARNEASQMPLMRIRTVIAVVGLLQKPSQTLPIQRLCYNVLAALADNKDAHDTMSREDGLTYALKALVHSDDQIRYQALKVTSGFSRHDKGRAHLLSHDALKYLKQTLENANTNPALALDETSTILALSTLGHISENEDGQKKIAELGVVESVTALVHSHHGLVSEKALKALLNFSNYDPTKEILLSIHGFAGGLYARALRGVDAATKTLSISILNNLSSSDNFMKEIGVNALVELVNSMPSAPVIIQRVIARVIKAAARNDDVKNALVDNACISIFTGIMNNTRDDFVLAEIIDAFAILTKNDRIRKVIIACGHTIKIVSLLGSHLFKRLQLPIITVIANFTLEGPGVEAVLRLNGAFTLFCRFALIHQDVAVQTHSLMAVSNLLINDTYREELINAGVLEAALYLMFSKDMDLQIGAVRVVAKVAQSSRFHQYLQEEEILEQLKELKVHENFKKSGNARLVTAFKELVFALKSAGTFPTVPDADKEYFWIKSQLNDFIRFLRVPVNISLESLSQLVKASFDFKEDHKISLMFRDNNYPVVIESSDELLLFWMNYQSGKKVVLQVFDGDVPDATVEEITFTPPPPAPPPPPPGSLSKRKDNINPYATPAYIKTHNLGETKMTLKPSDQNALLPENLLSDILNAVKDRSEGKTKLNSAAARPLNPLPASGSGSPSSFAQLKPVGQRGNENIGGREFFRDVGKWYRGVQQVFLMYPIMIKVVFDVVDSRSDHKSFAKCFETALADLPHMLPHMKSQTMGQEDFADGLLKIGFNVKSSKFTGPDGKEQTKYELLVRPSSLPPELLLKAILLSTASAGI